MPPILLNLISGLTAQTSDLDVASRNLTNLRTPGYRKERLSFHDLVYRAITTGRDRAGIRGATTVGAGADVRAPELVQRQAEFEATGHELDLAIYGQGFFQYRLEDGSTAFSRYAGLRLDQGRRLVNSDGLPIEPEIRLPEGLQDWRVRGDGSILGHRADGSDVEVATGIRLVRFSNPAALSRSGPYLLMATERSGPPVEGRPGDEDLGEIVQGYLEASNVNYAEEMANVLHAQRTYQISLRALQALDESLGLANNIRRG